MIKNKTLYVVFIIALLITAKLTAQNGKYIPMDDKHLSSIIPSSTRYIVNLSGKWEQSDDNENWEVSYLPNVLNTQSKITYRRVIKIDKSLQKKLVWQLYFLGVDDQIEVYFNDQFVGRYLGAMTPFFVRIPDRAIYVENNTITLKVHAASSTMKQVKEQNLFSNKTITGIIRDVILVGTPQISVKAINHRISFNRENTATVKSIISIASGDLDKGLFVKSTIDSIIPTSQSRIVVSVETSLHRKGSSDSISNVQTKQVEIQKERTIDVDFYNTVSNPSLWSINNPNLYEIYVRIKYNGKLIDDFSCPIGFRDVYMSNIKNASALFVNGSQFELKGVDYIEDYASDGKNISCDLFENDLLLIKTLGANLIRFKYVLPHPYMLDLCDKYGIFVMIELPVYDIPNSIINLDEFKVRFRNITERILLAYDNHPSVLAWGVSDGIDEKMQDQIGFNQSIVKFLRSNSNKLIYKIVPLGCNAINAQGYDMVGLKPGKNNKSYDELYQAIKAIKDNNVNIPIFLSYGNIIQANNFNGYSDPLSIEAQAYYIRNLYHLALDLKCIGSLVWSFNDYQMENPSLTTDNENQNLGASGLVDINRRQRLAFSVLQSLFNNERQPLFNAGNYSDKSPIYFIIIGLILCIFIIAFLNRFRRFREYLYRSILRPYNFYADIRDQRIMSPVQTFLLCFIIALSVGLYLASILFYYRTSLNAQYLFMMFIPNKTMLSVFYRLIWMPELFSLIITVLVLIKIFILAYILKLFSLFVRQKIYFTDTFTIIVWSSVPLIILLPISIVLCKLLLFAPSFIYLFIPLFIAFICWIIFRIFKATAVVFDVKPLFVYLIGFGLIGLVLFVFIGYYQYQYSVFSFLDFYLKIFAKN